MAVVKEGSTEAPVRRPLAWQSAEFWDEAKLDAELRRVFDLCHGCRRCFNLCDSFPRLFDLVDASPTGELDEVKSADFKPAIDACTLCDLCFMTVCPYVPPHDFDLDFPHLVLRARAIAHSKGETPFAARQLTATDRNGTAASLVSTLANWATDRGNALGRGVLQAAADVHREAALPRFAGRTFAVQAAQEPPALNRTAPAFGRKAVLYATCFCNYNNPEIGMATRAVLAHLGVETEVVYPACCGMPQLEHGDLESVAAKARKVSAALGSWIERGYDVVALVPSCALMLKFEWPLILPGDAAIAKLSKATRDIAQYVVEIARKEGLPPGLKPLPGGVALHLACHARAQNLGPKAAEMLKLIPGAELSVIERCSGHGGSWGITSDNFPVAIKQGRPVARQANAALIEGKRYLASECPLAGEHILQGVERLPEPAAAAPEHALHPIQLFALAYGLGG
ncbi:MAG: glycerol-3-phosphate dehydrogenase [Alphaproteobacteria bacterium]|nr:glycerol-3-phosphate dehydrogenase [Alphaproteobacteria bacterium]